MQLDIAHLANALLARGLYVALVILCVVWHVEYMGGYSMSPDDLGGGKNDTVSLFNWHPLMLIFAFPVFKTEAILTYLAVPFDGLPRQLKKIIHACFQTAAMIFIVLGLVAVFRSHSEKEPKALKDLYSVHSYVAISALVVFALQFVFGGLAFILQLIPAKNRAEYAPFHRFFGMVGYLVGLAAILTGLQERETFNVRGKHHVHFHGYHEPLMVIPNVMAVITIFLAVTVALQSTFLRPKEVAAPEEGPSIPPQSTAVSVPPETQAPLLEKAGQ